MHNELRVPCFGLAGMTYLTLVMPTGVNVRQYIIRLWAGTAGFPAIDQVTVTEPDSFSFFHRVPCPHTCPRNGNWGHPASMLLMGEGINPQAENRNAR